MVTALFVAVLVGLYMTNLGFLNEKLRTKMDENAPLK